MITAPSIDNRPSRLM